MYVSNLPYIWGFVRQVMPGFRIPSSSRGRSSRSRGTRPSDTALTANNTFQHITSISRSETGYKGENRNDSEENIIQPVADHGDIGLHDLEPDKSGYILRTTEIHVSRESRQP